MAARWLFSAPGLAEANERLEYERLSPEERRRYDKYVDMECSNKSTIYTAKLEGKAEGKAEGMAAVFALLEKGVPLAEAKRQLGM